MFETSSITPMESLTFWFVRNGVSRIWSVFNTAYMIASQNNLVGPIAQYNEELGEVFNINHDITAATSAEIRDGFTLFINGRPEYEVGRLIDSKLLADNADDSAAQDRGYLFEKILTGAIIMQYSDESPSYPDLGIKRAERCIQWLRNTDFYNAPASTRFHESEPGGLIKHTLKVLNQVYQLLTIPAFSNVKLYEAVIVALAHDWCKIGVYESYMKNVKDETTGIWNKVPAYKRKDADIPFGHGVASMYIAQKFFHLNMQQALAIRWHMGSWYVADSDINELQHSNETYPLVHLIQFADQLAITAYAN